MIAKLEKVLHNKNGTNIEPPLVTTTNINIYNVVALNKS